MTYRTRFEAEFRAGHLVIDPHVHTYRVGITCSGEPDHKGATEGMVVDFRLLAEVFDAAIRSELEGYMLVGPNDNTSTLESGLPVKQLPSRPTVEHLAFWCFQRVTEKLGNPLGQRVERVTVWENDSCMASYERCS
jgi:6-pyruvoyl-tetrahydropterin synthase